VTGSHYDTVIDAGKFDGRLGVLRDSGGCAAAWRGRATPVHVNDCCLLPKRRGPLQSTFLGSRALAGRFDPAVLDSVDADGITMRQAMLRPDWIRGDSQGGS